MHSVNIIHRDLKLENILIDDNFDVKIIDFGFATVCKSYKKLDLMCGTPCYMDPDIVQEKLYLGQPVDVWALGVILYYLVTGKWPFYSDDQDELYAKIVKGKWSFPDAGNRYTVKLQNFLDRIFTVEAKERIRAEEMLEDPWMLQDGLPKPERKIPDPPKKESAHKEKEQSLVNLEID